MITLRGFHCIILFILILPFLPFHSYHHLLYYIYITNNNGNEHGYILIQYFFWFLIGDPRSFCENGAWTFTEMPICVKPGCPDLDTPENGYSLSSYSGSVREFFCFNGFSGSGSRGQSGVNSQNCYKKATLFYIVSYL